MKNFKKENKGNASKKKKRALATASGLALIALLSGTFAWLNAQDERVNRLESLAISDGSVSVNEVFDPTPIQAGADATKEVSITNGGSSPVFIRASFEEVLKHLKNNAVEATTTSIWTAPAAGASDAEKAGVGVDLPVEFSDAKYTGWTDISSKVTGLPTGIKVMAQGSYKLDTATNKPVQEFEYVMYAPLPDGRNQKVTGDLVIAGYGLPAGTTIPTTTGTTAGDWTYTIAPASVKYYVYEDGYDINTVNWALNTLNNAAGEKTGAALLGTKGTRYGKAYDYREQADGGIIPDGKVTPGTAATLTTDYPTGTNPTSKIQADNKDLITLSYNGTDLLDPTTMTDTDKDKWVYNPEDGWFYYTGFLPTGQTSTDLLKKVKYSVNIDKEYSNATYDLVVKMEAVQADKQALTDSTAGGFGLDASQPISKKIIDVMTKSLP